jgi:hypothetical protein
MARQRRSREELKEVDGLVELNRLVKHRLTVLTGPITPSEYLTEVRRGQTSPVE